MTPPLSLNGLTVPDDFPASPFEAVYAKLAPHTGHDAYPKLVGALAAIAIRFKALAEYDQQFTASIKAHGDGPGQPWRYEQDRDLFGFFSNGISIFDAFCFALFSIGALKGSPEFPLKTEDERKVDCRTMRKAYGAAFPGDPLLNVLEQIEKQMEDFRVIRNILTHRAVPSRTFKVSSGSSGPDSAWFPRLLNLQIDAETTSSQRSQLANLLRSGFDATVIFVNARLS